MHCYHVYELISILGELYVLCSELRLSIRNLSIFLALNHSALDVSEDVDNFLFPSLHDLVILRTQKWTQNQASSSIFGRACDFSKLPRIFRRVGPRRIVRRRHDARSVKALFSSRASNMSTAKWSRLPTNITTKDRAKLFCTIAVLPIQVVFRLKKTQKPFWPQQ